MHWVYLAFAIVSEVAASSALPSVQGLRHPASLVAVMLGYGAAFYFLSLTLEAIPLGVAYAIWSGVGVALITLFGWVFYRQTLSPAEIIGLLLIVTGAVVLRAQ
jgi:small multidrug resistance pump